MSRSIKHIDTLKKKLGQTVKVCTIEGHVGICKVTEGDEGWLLFLTDDDSLGMSEFFWRTAVHDVKYGHWVATPRHITEELKWITSDTSFKSTTKKPEKKKDTDEEIVLEPKSVEELWAKAPCKVRLKDGQVGYAETEAGRKEHATVYFNEGVDGDIGWEADHPTYKRGWHVNCIEDFETIFGKKDEKPVVETKETNTTKITRDDAFRPLNIEQLKENIPCHVILKDDQIAYAEYEDDTPKVYMHKMCDERIGWPTDDKEGFKYGWYIWGEEDFKEIFQTFEGKEVQTEEPSLQEVLKEILETLKEIKNEIAKR